MFDWQSAVLWDLWLFAKLPDTCCGIWSYPRHRPVKYVVANDVQNLTIDESHFLITDIVLRKDCDVSCALSSKYRAHPRCVTATRLLWTVLLYCSPVPLFSIHWQENFPAIRVRLYDISFASYRSCRRLLTQWTFLIQRLFSNKILVGQSSAQSSFDLCPQADFTHDIFLLFTRYKSLICQWFIFESFESLG